MLILKRTMNADALSPVGIPLALPLARCGLMSGLPGSGKDTWLARNRADLPVVSLDDIRRGTGCRAGAVATSSVMKRTWSQGEKVRHHLIDPRTGESADTDWLSVTAISPDIVTAEVYSKVILIGGAGELADLLNVRPELTFIAVDPDGNLLGSPDYKKYIYESTIGSTLSIGFPY